jgi:hypothetical protein
MMVREIGGDLMITKKSLIAFLLAFCISSILFATFPTRSQTTSSYDPWADVSGPTVGEPDGVIDMRDIGYEVTLFTTRGIPINRTDPLSLQSQIDQLNSSIQQLNARIEPVEFSDNDTTTIDFIFQGENGPPITDVVQVANFTWTPKTVVSGSPFKVVRIMAYFEYMIENPNASYLYLFNPRLSFNNADVYLSNWAANGIYGGPNQFTSVPGLVETTLNNVGNYTLTFKAYGQIYVGLGSERAPTAEELAMMHIVLRNIHVLIFDLY